MKVGDVSRRRRLSDPARRAYYAMYRAIRFALKNGHRQRHRQVRKVPSAEVWQPVSVTDLLFPVRPDPSTAARQRDDDGLCGRVLATFSGPLRVLGHAAGGRRRRLQAATCDRYRGPA